MSSELDTPAAIASTLDPPDATASNVPAHVSQWRRILAVLLRWPAFSVGLIVVVLFLLAAVLAPQISPYDPTIGDYSAILQGPSARHIFGTDDLGRDLFSRIIYGARYSLAISGSAVALATLLGIPLGLAAGYFGGLFDSLVSRIADALFAFPAVLMAIAIAATMGASVQSAVVALTLISVPEFTRVARGAMIAEREASYVEVSRALGSSWRFIIFRSIMPNALGPLLVLISLGFANGILNQAALTFLGLGAQPPTPEWGAILGVARGYLFNAQYFAVFPGLAIVILVFAFNLVGDGVRDLVDPRQRR